VTVPVAQALRLLVADDRVTRAGVGIAVADQGIEVCAEAGDAVEAVATALRERPDVALVGVELRGGGIQVAEQISRRAPETAVVMLADELRQDDLFAALRAGASGYLLKDTTPTRLGHTLRGAVAGEPALSRQLVGLVIEGFRKRSHRMTSRRQHVRRDLPVALTEREWEVLELLGQRADTGEMAAALSISGVTVRRHVSQIVRKLGVPDRRAVLHLLEQDGANR
jgi:DNA-binding NarL/FixJ family response regulator